MPSFRYYMQLYKIRGGNKESLEMHSYNIGVGISLGNKWFTSENITELVKWSLQHTKEYVIVYVADSIHAINLEVRNRISHDKALAKALVMGRTIVEETKTTLEAQLSAEDLKKVRYCNWQEIENESYIEHKKYLYLLYEKNEVFRNTIKNIIQNYIAKEIRVFSDKEITKLGEYIIEELPEIINRVQMKGIVCDAYVYPFDGELTQLTEKIQLGLLFPEIKQNILNTDPKVFLEVR